MPFDVDGSVVALCEEELTELYPGLNVHGVVGDFDHDLGRIPDGERRLFAFLGGTIGNFPPAERARFLEEVGGLHGPDRPAGARAPTWSRTARRSRRPTTTARA